MFAVITARGPRWDATRGIRSQDEWESHAACMDRLVDEGVIVLGGPIGGAPGQPDEIALLAIRADSAEHVHSLFDADPWIVSGILKLASVRPWTIWLDSRPRTELGVPGGAPDATGLSGQS
jgi:hypothetical protein